MHNYIKSDSETALMENRKLLERMYEVADGPRIQMWQALTTTDKLPESDIVSGLVSVSLGGKKSHFQPKEWMQSNLLATVGSGITI